MVGIAACILHAACGSDPVHVYQGRLYVKDRDCLGTPSSIDVVSGSDPGDCAPTCLLDTLAADASDTLYVSTMCAPYPYGIEPSGTDPSCATALAAFERDDTCLSDGGSTHPLPGSQTDSDAGVDGGH